MSETPETTATEIPDDAVVLDVREQNEWDAGHAPNAVHIPLGDVPVRLGDLPEPADGVLPVICRSGNRSGRAVAWLTEQGFDVANVVGGMKAWDEAGKPVVADSGAPRVL